MTPAARYDSNNSSVIGNLTPGFEQFETMEGLTNPGDVAHFEQGHPAGDGIMHRLADA